MSDKLKKSIGRIAESRPLGWIANLPPIAWLVRRVARNIAKRHLAQAIAEEAETARAAVIGLDATLQQIVYDVVTALGYAGAMVATYEQGDALPVRAFYVDPNLATAEQIQRWEEEVSKYTTRPVSITDPAVARVYVYQDECKQNLSVRAVRGGKPVISNDLYDLFTPVAPPASRPIIRGIQDALGIQQVIAVPFFLETQVNGKLEREVVGNLFAAKRGEISAQDKLILSAFGRQAAAAIESERRRIQIQISQEIVFELQAQMQDEQKILQRIVDGLVFDLGYPGAMVATYEPDDSLPVRAFRVDPALASEEQIRKWEQEVSQYSVHQVSITDPEIARVFVYMDAYKNNLSVRAFKAGGIVISNDLFDLFTPIAPLASKPVVKGIQQALGIQQVIAVPFFMESFSGASVRREIVGNLFAATRSRQFSGGEIEMLKAFGQQAAAGIRNARLYRQVEERRQVAQIFGKMAFSAAASVHALRNHIGAFQVHLNLIRSLPPEQRDQILALSDKIMDRLAEATRILDSLHEPWQATVEMPTDINACVRKAMSRVIQDEEEIRVKEGIVVHAVLADGLPPINTVPDMLIEAFRVLIKNALEAVREKGKGGEIKIETRLGQGPYVEATVSDTGIGIKPMHLSKVFELRWSTKGEAGMGFGLFWTKEYIEGLGGSIRVESVWEEGSTFYVRLPIQSQSREHPVPGPSAA